MNEQLNTNMTFYKGYKFGLIGEGGKTTLLAAVSENKVDNFPDANEVKCVFVQTDITGQSSHLKRIEHALIDQAVDEPQHQLSAAKSPAVPC